jgi:S-adenosylmethionine hydrolase
MSARPLVLFTDFGSTEFYPGVMRAVLASSSPTSPVIDLDHDIPAHDIDAASFVLARAFEYLPRNAVVVAVVDPGVGTARRGLIVTIGERTIVAPDNGLVSDLLVSTANPSTARFVRHR